MLKMQDFCVDTARPAVIGYAGENLSRVLEVETDSGPEWIYYLECRMGGRAVRAAEMPWEDGVLRLPLTDSILRVDGPVWAQIVALRGEDVCKKSNLFLLQIGPSVNAAGDLEPLEETAFQAQERRLMALVAQAEEAVHTPTVGENGNWWVWKSETASYRDSGIAAGGAAVSSVNGRTGDVVLDAEAVGALPDSTPLFSGDYNDLENKPTIPSAVTESTVAGWGFTKNTGTYSKPVGGIPASDLASAVRTSLSKADTALQAHQDVSGKENASNKVTSISAESTDTQYPSAKAVFDFIAALDGNGVAY